MFENMPFVGPKKPIYNRFTRPYLLLFLTAIFFSLYSLGTYASYQKDLWPLWQVNNPLNQEKITHEEWRIFLKKNVKKNKENIALLDYKRISVQDMHLLNSYIIRLSKIHIENYNRQEQLAYWLNLYNALTVQLIIKHFPIVSIQDINISPGLFSIGPWGANLVKINDHFLTLDEMLNRIIRPIWNDARILYALNNGSIGSPNLHTEPFMGTTLESQLNQVTAEYVNSLRAVQIIENKLILSRIYDWFQEDFGGSKFIIKHLIPFANEPLKTELRQIHTIDRYAYNWHLNNITSF